MSEHAEQSALVSWFKLQHPKLKLIAIPNGSHLAGDARLRAIKMRKMKDEGLTIGAPDLMLVAPNKHYHGLFIEMKFSTKQSEAQEEFEQYANQHGYKYAVAYTWEVAKQIIEDYLNF